ncbi:MAG: TonB family protein [Proteobacteria bacterium]|nr:MAG: TonB family protein [Pseudomonadota bacterium]
MKPFGAWRTYFAGSVVGHALALAAALFLSSDLDRHAPQVMYADLLSSQAPAEPAPAPAPRPRKAISPPAADASSDPALTAKAPAPKASEPPAAEPAEGKAGSASNPAPPAKVSGGEMNLYVGKVIDLLNRVRVYPRDALAREEEGVVVLEVNVAGDGNLSSEKVEVPCPYASLNRAAVEAIRRVGHFPPPPGANAIVVHVPIRFRLENR